MLTRAQRRKQKKQDNERDNELAEKVSAVSINPLNVRSLSQQKTKTHKGALALSATASASASAAVSLEGEEEEEEEMNIRSCASSSASSSGSSSDGGSPGSESGSEGPTSPPTPHKIQSLDENSLRLDETFLAISPKIATRLNHNVIPANNTANQCPPKPALIKSQPQHKTNKLGEDDKNKNKNGKVGVVVGKKITDYLPPRRTSNRKTQETIREEKHQLLIKYIVEQTEDGLQAKRFSGKGRGVVATKRFLKNEFVVEYAGKLMGATEARAKDAKYARDGFTGCYMYYFTHNNQQYCVDATEESGRMGRLINHSRSGNLSTKVVEVGGLPRLIFIAKRDVDEGEELTYDYGDRSRESLRHHPWLAY